MTRGRGFSSSRSSYRGSSGRGGSWGGGRGGYGSRGNSHFSSFSNSYDSRSKYGGSSDRYSNSRGHEDYRKSYRSVSTFQSVVTVSTSKYFTGTFVWWTWQQRPSISWPEKNENWGTSCLITLFISQVNVSGTRDLITGKQNTITTTWNWDKE